MKTERLITKLNEKSPLSEPYFTLRTNIKFSTPDKSLKLINVTSPGIGDGKSTTCANLALTYAKSGERVLLIDADLRRPTQHHLFNLYNQEGLTNVVVLNESHESVVQRINPNLDVMTAGLLPTNPVEFMGSHLFHQFLKEIREFYDVIIIDTPPVGMLTDAALLAPHCDGTLLVVAKRKTSIKLAQQAKQALQNVNANVIGCVMTRSETDKKAYQYCELSDERVSQKIKWWKRRKRGIQI